MMSKKGPVERLFMNVYEMLQSRSLLLESMLQERYFTSSAASKFLADPTQFLFKAISSECWHLIFFKVSVTVKLEPGPWSH